MTSRLKHKLELEQINVKSSYLNESFVQIGTPLPALANTKKDQLEYVPEWQQEVRDEQGRRRFHGAFTGGWSAGYFNSVGSKEGWSPASFKSSRNNRASKVQRAEDFMDEEDLAQLKDDRRLENTETFRDGGFAGMREAAPDRGLPSSLESLIAPARSSIGSQLLQKMGWRPGQGIGPRVTLRKLRLQESKLGKAQQASASTLAMDVDEDDALGNGEASKHTFAPRDTRLMVFGSKEGREGLGYEKGRGMGRLPQKGFTRKLDDDEDEDPYATLGESSQSRVYAFDSNENGDDDVVNIGGAPPRSGPTFRPPGQPAASSDTSRWHDGRPVLPGFELDPLGVPPDKWFELPEIPPDWRPRPARVWGSTRKFDQQPGYKEEGKEVIRDAPGKPLTFEQRGQALGEEQRVSKAKSVFEYMSEKDRERLAAFAAVAKQVAPPPPAAEEESKESSAPSISAPPPTEVVIPPLSPRTAGAALRGFMPYSDDLPKQERYRSYLHSQTYNTKTPNPDLKTGSVDDINKELEDFAKSARIFKPMSFAMSNRFTSGSASLAASDMKQARPGLHMYDAERAKALEAEKKKAEEVVEVKKAMTPREEAADKGMFGSMTREVKEFYPVKLLCKRFGVSDPHPEGPPKGSADGPSGTGETVDEGALPKNDASWADAFVHKEGTDVETPSTQGPAAAKAGPDAVVQGERPPRSIAEVGMADDVNQGRDTLTYTKPSMAIFKAIFASDDEDDSEDEADTSGAGRADRDVKPVVSDTVVTSGGGGVVAGPSMSQPVAHDRPADLATFKPVFAARRDTEPVKGPADAAVSSMDTAKTADRDRSERKEKKRKKPKRSGVLSFDVGEDEADGGDEVDEAERERERAERKRKRKEREREKKTAPASAPQDQAVPEEDMWVEKPPINPRTALRKGAADFM